MENNYDDNLKNYEKDEKEHIESENLNKFKSGRPSNAFIGASWSSLFVGILAYLIGLWNATTMQLNEKGYYFVVLLFGLFSAISLQKTVRDKEEGVATTGIYYAICWFGLLASIILITAGLWNASLTKSEKGFYAISFCLSLFSSVTVQKNIRDTNNL